MCSGCYEEYGRPEIDTGATRRAAELIARVYDHACMGGHLHIAVDDWNLESSHVAFCSGQIDSNKQDADAEQLAVERECCDALMALSLAERASALALHRGYLAAT
jgi:hypothetical protein